MVAIYTYLDLQNAVSEIIHGKNNNIIDPIGLSNRAVRTVMTSVDLRSSKRKLPISPGLYQDVYSYPAPADIKATAVTDIQRQVRRYAEWFLTTPAEFDRLKTRYKNLVAFDNHDLMTFLNLSCAINTQELIINDFESLTANGTFVASGDASNLSINTTNFLNGSASMQFSTASSNSTAVVTNSTMTKQDLTLYDGNETFLWIYIPNITGLTSFTLKLGSDSTDYFSQAVTTTHEGLAFYVGWNLLRFEIPSASSQTGTPVITAINYMQLVITKTSSLPAQTGWLVDFLVCRIGDIHSIEYYSKYAWNNSSGAYIEKTTGANTDLLVADTDEFNLIVQQYGLYAGRSARLPASELKDIADELETMYAEYKMKYPSDRMLYQTTYEFLGSLEGDFDILTDNANNPDGNTFLFDNTDN